MHPAPSPIITDIPFEKIIRIARRFGADYADVFAERTRQTTIVCDDRRIEQAQTSCDAGVGIRMIADGRTAHGSTNDLTRKGLLELARRTGQAAAAKRTRSRPIAFSERRAPCVTTVSQHPLGIAIEEKCGVVQRANDAAWQEGKPIRQVKIFYRDAVRRIVVASSEGYLAEDEQVDTIFTAHVVAGDGSCLQTGYEPMAGSAGFELFDQTPPEEVADRAARRALKMLSARPAPAGTMPVIISSEAGGTMIHEAVGHGLEADFAGEGWSVYSGRIGQTVAAGIVSVVDDATLPKMRGSFTFDDEGTPARRTVLIEKGVLVSYLADRRTSMRFGIPSTGSGRRGSYEHPPIPRMTNTLILPGRDDPAQIVRDTPTGLFVRKMGGGQVNTVNGDFVFEVQEGYLIEGGRIGEAVRGATLVGNGPRVLLAIDRVGKDLGFSIGTCGKEGQDVPVSCGQPTIRIPELVVGGTRL